MKHSVELMAYPFYDHTSMEEHFTAKARSGWRVSGIGAMIHYHRAEPADVKYAVTYIDNSRHWLPPTGSELQFQDYCEEAGWELVAEDEKIKVFCNEDPDAVPLETEPLVQVNNISICAVDYKMKWVFCVLVSLFLAWLNLKPLLQGGSLSQHPETLLFGIFWLFCAGISVNTYISYVLWEHRAKRNAENQMFTPTHSHYKIQLWGLAIFWCIIPVYMFIRHEGGLDGFSWVLAAILGFGPAIVEPGTFRRRREGVPWFVNWLLSYGGIMIIIMVVFVVIYLIKDVTIS